MSHEQQHCRTARIIANAVASQQQQQQQHWKTTDMRDINYCLGGTVSRKLLLHGNASQRTQETREI